MQTDEMRAREVLAAEYRKDGYMQMADGIEQGQSPATIRAMLAFQSEARAVPPDGERGELMQAVINQNDAMRQELAHLGNLVSDLARAMGVDQANADGSWPDLAGRIRRLHDAALATSPASLPRQADREAIRQAVFRHTGCSESCADAAADAIVELREVAGFPPDREAIARIMYVAFGCRPDLWEDNRKLYYNVADAILALSGSLAPEGGVSAPSPGE